MFKDRLKKVRELKDISQDDLAKKLKVAPSTVSMWERGDRQPKLNKLVEIADLFDVTTDYLLGRGILSVNEHEEKTETDIIINEIKKSTDIQKIVKLLLELDSFDKGQVYLTMKNLHSDNKYKKGQSLA